MPVGPDGLTGDVDDALWREHENLQSPLAKDFRNYIVLELREFLCLASLPNSHVATMGSIVLPHLRTAWHVDQAILSEEERLVVIRFGRDHDPDCEPPPSRDSPCCKPAPPDFAVIYLCDIDEVPDFNTMYELYDTMTIMYFYRNKHMMCDFGTGNNNKLNWVLEDKQELIDIIETIYKGAKKGRGLVVSPKELSTGQTPITSNYPPNSELISQFVVATLAFDVTHPGPSTTPVHRNPLHRTPHPQPPRYVLFNMIDQRIFENLQTKIDEETTVRDPRAAPQSPDADTRRLGTVRDCQYPREKGPTCAALRPSQQDGGDSADVDIPDCALTDPLQTVKPVLDDAAVEILAQKEEVARLKAVADQHPFYKYNGVWSRELQNLVASIQLCAWLGGLQEHKGEGSASFMTIEDVGKFLESMSSISCPIALEMLENVSKETDRYFPAVPVNLKEQDAFHLTIEEYLLALISMIEELSRLAVNSVTLGDYARPVQIGNFIKDIFAGFQLLNLKNDILRKRSDGIKYSVKKVEDVVYDLSLRNLIPKGSAAV
ncbi:uncharacterized protein N7459_000959 [Penicillium hispanicum]|uniref:uncharacterized protein n=1 Tax=Penicillium hispanicum TaxID=1080232 RepID=UPI0025410DB2|nr:uncharacterized protein N7459_000959 [Penicillium hispanicum]KAJ5594751.1 hypothetical protein N7459_000959 [Penicillium hispanicum]